MSLPDRRAGVVQGVSADGSATVALGEKNDVALGAKKGGANLLSLCAFDAASPAPPTCCQLLCAFDTASPPPAIQSSVTQLAAVAPSSLVLPVLGFRILLWAPHSVTADGWRLSIPAPGETTPEGTLRPAHPEQTDMVPLDGLQARRGRCLGFCQFDNLMMICIAHLGLFSLVRSHKWWQRRSQPSCSDLFSFQTKLSEALSSSEESRGFAHPLTWQRTVMAPKVSAEAPPPSAASAHPLKQTARGDWQPKQTTLAHGRLSFSTACG